MLNPHQFGARLALYRERQKLTVTRLAALAGIDFMQIRRYEKGQTMPTLESAARLAVALGISLDELANGAEPPKPLTFQNQHLLQQMHRLDQLPPERQEMAMRVLETVITGYELEGLSERLKR
jgi:transcriptional regulator with XRE-family HTH domain